jgi:hypothetical protein
MKKILIIFLIFLSNYVFAHEAPKTSAEKQNYIDNYLKLFEIEAKIINTWSDEKKPGVRFSIKNIGDETLKEVEVIVYFLDKNKKPFLEKKFYPVNDLSIGDTLKLLKPNYTYRKDKNIYSTVDNLGDEWSGLVDIKIVNIEFAD